MKFESFQALLFMEGHGIYVWSVYVFSVVFFVGLALRPIMKKKTLVKAIRQRIAFSEQELS